MLHRYKLIMFFVVKGSKSHAFKGFLLFKKKTNKSKKDYKMLSLNLAPPRKKKKFKSKY